MRNFLVRVQKTVGEYEDKAVRLLEKDLKHASEKDMELYRAVKELDQEERRDVPPSDRTRLRCVVYMVEAGSMAEARAVGLKLWDENLPWDLVKAMAHLGMPKDMIDIAQNMPERETLPAGVRYIEHETVRTRKGRPYDKVQVMLYKAPTP